MFDKIITLPRLTILLLTLAVSLSGCATFLGHDLPDYTFADLPEAPAENKVCLVVHDKDCDKKCHEWNDPIYEMFEKSGYFRKAPEQCTPGEDKDRLYIITLLDIKVDNWPVAILSGLICGASFGIIPGYQRDSVTTRIQIKKKDQIVKEYVYREHVDSWIHLSMLFKMSDHTPRAITHELQKRVYMNFLHDFSRDFNDGMFDPEKISSLPKISVLNCGTCN